MQIDFTRSTSDFNTLRILPPQRDLSGLLDLFKAISPKEEVNVIHVGPGKIYIGAVAPVLAELSKLGLNLRQPVEQISLRGSSGRRLVQLYDLSPKEGEVLTATERHCPSLGAPVNSEGDIFDLLSMKVTTLEDNAQHIKEQFGSKGQTLVTLSLTRSAYFLSKGGKLDTGCQLIKDDILRLSSGEYSNLETVYGLMAYLLCDLSEDKRVIIAPFENLPEAGTAFKLAFFEFLSLVDEVPEKLVHQLEAINLVVHRIILDLAPACSLSREGYEQECEQLPDYPILRGPNLSLSWNHGENGGAYPEKVRHVTIPYTIANLMSCYLSCAKKGDWRSSLLSLSFRELMQNISLESGRGDLGHVDEIVAMSAYDSLPRALRDPYTKMTMLVNLISEEVGEGRPVPWLLASLSAFVGIEQKAFKRGPLVDEWRTLICEQSQEDRAGFYECLNSSGLRGIVEPLAGLLTQVSETVSTAPILP